MTFLDEWNLRDFIFNRCILEKCRKHGRKLPQCDEQYLQKKEKMKKEREKERKGRKKERRKKKRRKERRKKEKERKGNPAANINI